MLQMRTADVAKLVSQAWKSLSNMDRDVFLDMAKRDKERYEREKASYKGPWKVIDTKESAPPKKPMSAFLSFGGARKHKVMATSDNDPNLTTTVIPVAPPLLRDLRRDTSAHLQSGYHQDNGRLRLLPIPPTMEDVIRHGSPPVPSSMLDGPVELSVEDAEQSLLSFTSTAMVESGMQQEDESPSVMSTEVSQATTPKEITSANEIDAEYLKSPTAEHFTASFVLKSADNSNNHKSYFSYHVEEATQLSPFSCLTPLISTDTGGYLAAAALLESSSDLIFGA